MPTEQQTCKEIEVDSTNVDLGNDTTLCEGQTYKIDAGKGYQSYLWNSGETTQTISVNTSGTYSITVTNHSGCIAEDSIHVDFKPNIFTTFDTSICFGETYFAGGKLQSASGTYIDTLLTINGCENVVTTHLFVGPSFSVNIGKDTCITDTTTIHLIANVPGATSYTWQDGTHDSTITVTAPGLYWVRVFVNNCSKSDSIQIITCPTLTYFYLPNAFTPNGDGLNDIFRPVGNEISEFHMIIYDRWGQLVFETDDFEKGWDGTFKGRYCDPGVYAYVLTYKSSKTEISSMTTTGVVTLVK